MRNAIQISDSRDFVRRAWEQAPGASASQIADVASELAGREITRNTVMGQLRRLGLALAAAKTEAMPISARKRVERERGPCVPVMRMPKAIKPQRAPKPVFEPVKPRLVSKSMPIDPAWGEVIAGEGIKDPSCGCTWVYGNPGPNDSVWRYCQDPRLQGRVYCSDHTEIAHVPFNNSKERSFVRHAVHIGTRTA